MEKNKIIDCQLYSTVTSGLEKLSKLEFQEKFSSYLKSLEISPGKILFMIQETESLDVILNKLLSDLKSVEHLYLILFSFDLDNDQMIIFEKEHLEEKAKKLNFLIFQKFSQIYLANKQKIITFIDIYQKIKAIELKTLKFRIDIKENVIQRPEKNELAKILAEFIESNYNFLDPDINEYFIKFNLEKIDKTYHFSIKLTMNKPIGISQISETREKTPATMRPSIAYNLCRLLNIEEGDIIIDPMCGSSTIIEIALKEFKNQAYYICADIDLISLEKSQKNLGKLGFVDIILCNSMKSPFRPGIFNKIITDMPFGKRCGSHQQNLKIYPCLTQEFNRILIEGGKAVVVTTEKSLIFNNFKKKKGWSREEVFMINKGGLEVYVSNSKKKSFLRKKKKVLEEKKEEEEKI